MGKPRSFLVGVIVGGGIGVLLGRLFALESEEGTRERVRDQGQRLTGRVREQMNRVADEVRAAAQNVAGEVRERAGEFAMRAQGIAKEMVHRARTTLEEEANSLSHAQLGTSVIDHTDHNPSEQERRS